MPPAPTDTEHDTELMHPTVFYCSYKMRLAGFSDLCQSYLPAALREPRQPSPAPPGNC